MPCASRCASCWRCISSNSASVLAMAGLRIPSSLNRTVGIDVVIDRVGIGHRAVVGELDGLLDLLLDRLLDVVEVALGGDAGLGDARLEAHQRIAGTPLLDLLLAAV